MHFYDRGKCWKEPQKIGRLWKDPGAYPTPVSIVSLGEIRFVNQHFGNGRVSVNASQSVIGVFLYIKGCKEDSLRDQWLACRRVELEFPSSSPAAAVNFSGIAEWLNCHSHAAV